jgi:hypothetical protein
MSDERGVLTEDDGIVSGIEEYRYDKVPVTGPERATVYDVEK